MAVTERPGDAVARNRDVRFRAVLLFGFWLFAGAAVIHLAMWGLFRGLERQEERRDTVLSEKIAASLKRTPPEPRLEPDPLAPGRRMRAEENAMLATYGWVDRDRGLVRLPIDRAMELLVERGLPPSKPMPAPAAAPAPEQKR